MNNLPKKMKSVFLLLALGMTGFLLSGYAGQVKAQEPADLFQMAKDAAEPWHIHGKNTASYEHYIVDGNQAASPFRFDDEQIFDEFNINLDRRISPYERWQGQIFGVLNGSSYRSNEGGFVPERLSLFREKGDSSLPHRAQVGDYFGFFSFRTLQSSLKGAQVEFQPAPNHSLQIFTGARQSSWRRMQLSDNYNNGASYLFQSETIGRWGLNFVHNYRQGNNQLGTLDRNQAVFSLAGEKMWQLGSQNINTELEIAGLNGDHNGLTGAASGQDRKDAGVFFQLTGNSESPLTYRVRYERYGQDFRPAGAVVTPDRQTVEGHAGWRFDTGLQARFRIQQFVTALETVNSNTTRTFGLSVNGPILRRWMNNLTTNLNAFIQDVDNETGSIDQTIQTINLDLSKPLVAGWNGRFNFFWQKSNDHIGTANTETKVVTVSADHPVNLWGWEGSVTPGIAMREIHVPQGSGSTDVIPTLAAVLEKGRHHLGFNSEFRNQNRHPIIQADVNTFTFNADYRYRMEQHTLGLEVTNINRDPTIGQSTDSVRVGAFWTWFFDKPARVATRPSSQISRPASPQPASQFSGGELTLADLSPGLSFKEATRRVSVSGMGTPTPQDPFKIYEVRWFRNIDQRQRLALENKRGKLARSGLVIEFQDIGNVDTFRQTFKQIQEALLARYGRFTTFFEKGQFSANLMQDINNDVLIRIYEWETPDGIIRLGIPRRLDRQVRIEVQIAPSFPSVQDTLWSLRAIR